MSTRRKSKGSVRAVIALFTAAAVALGGTGLWLFNGKKSAPKLDADAPRYTVRRGDLQITLKQTGTFAAAEAKKIRAEIRGSAKIVWLVEEGTIVKEGAILVELDKTDVVEELDRRKEQLEKAEANLAAAEANEVISRLECQSNIRKAQMSVEMTVLEIKKFKEGVLPK